MRNYKFHVWFTYDTEHRLIIAASHKQAVILAMACAIRDGRSTDVKKVLNKDTNTMYIVNGIDMHLDQEHYKFERNNGTF